LLVSLPPRLSRRLRQPAPLVFSRSPFRPAPAPHSPPGHPRPATPSAWQIRTFVLSSAQMSGDSQLTRRNLDNSTVRVARRGRTRQRMRIDLGGHAGLRSCHRESIHGAARLSVWSDAQHIIPAEAGIQFRQGKSRFLKMANLRFPSSNVRLLG
jgi:hypothetical protein